MNKSTAIDRIPASSKYALVVLMLVYSFNFLDRQILVILQEPIKADLGLSDGQLGLLTGFAFAVFYVTAGLPIAYWADRGNRRNIISLALAIWSAMTAISGLAQNYVHLLLARIGVGIGEAGGTPPAHAMISDYFPPTKRATALAVYSSGLYIGVMAGMMLGGYLGENYSWRIAFFVVGLPGVLIAIIVRTTVREPERGYWDVKKIDIDNSPSIRDTLKILSKSPVFWLMAIGSGIAAMVAYGVGNFTPSYLMRSHGMSLSEVGFYLAIIYGASGVVGSTLSGLIVDYLGKFSERWYLLVPAITTIISVPFNMMAFWGDTLWLVLVNIFIFHFFYCMFLSPVITVAHNLVPASMRALTSSILFLVLNIIGLGLGPTLVGFLSDFYSAYFSLGSESLRYSQLTVSSLGIPAAILFYLASKSLGQGSPEHSELFEVHGKEDSG